MVGQALDSGAIVIPGPGSNGHHKGMYRKDRECEEFGGTMLVWTPGFEEAWAEWWLRKALFSSAKKYELTLRACTDADQGDVKMFLRLNAKEPHFETTIPIPNTNGEWQTLGPFLLDTEIGGFKDTLFKMVVPKVEGESFCIKDFCFSPPGADETGDYSGPWWATWLKELESKVLSGGDLPTIENNEKEKLITAATKFQEASKALSLIGPDDKEAKIEAKEGKEEALQESQDAALAILESMDDTLEGMSLGSLELLQWLVLVQATPTNLGSYCHQASDQQIERLLKLLKEDTEMLKEMIVCGGAKGGFYGKALDIYYSIQEGMTTGKPILSRLQMAIALELCKPLPIMDTVTPIDPVERYFSYEKAYLNGDLDPNFEQFSVWELRMVVDSNASNAELEWGRRMLMTYRPDIAYDPNQHWRYSSIVKTDVKYRRPEWIREPKDMIQALSRGGKCGPRAFFGRFINKAFGNPTWGLLQPGHAALSKWTPTGWRSCLGGEVGTCNGREYEDFKYEVFIRKKFGDEVYFRKVDILEWLGVDEQDPKEHNSLPLARSPWRNLALTQRKRLGDTKDPFPQPEDGDCEVFTKIQELQDRTDDDEAVSLEDDGTIVIPSSSRSGERNVCFGKSACSGKQFAAQDFWWVELKIPGDLVPERKTYKLTMRIATVHDDDPTPFQWIIKSPHHPDAPLTEYTVPNHYTQGFWEETEPVEIDLGGGDEVLKLMRQKPSWPVVLKDFKLTPV